MGPLATFPGAILVSPASIVLADPALLPFEFPIPALSQGTVGASQDLAAVLSLAWRE